MFMVNEEEIDEGDEEDIEVPKAMGDIFESVAGAIYLVCILSFGLTVLANPFRINRIFIGVKGKMLFSASYKRHKLELDKKEANCIVKLKTQK